MALVPRYFGAVTIIVLVLMVVVRLHVLSTTGVRAFKFGETDRSDFLIPPFALLYVYLVFASAFGLPSPAARPLFGSVSIQLLGVALCSMAIALMAWTLASFGRSFRVGIDASEPGRLVTAGAFTISRNPIYVAFGFVLLGEFLIYSTSLMLAYLIAGLWLLNRQVLREEAFLAEHYGAQYDEYRARTRRYL